MRSASESLRISSRSEAAMVKSLPLVLISSKFYLGGVDQCSARPISVGILGRLADSRSTRRRHALVTGGVDSAPCDRPGPRFPAFADRSLRAQKKSLPRRKGIWLDERSKPNEIRHLAVAEPVGCRKNREIFLRFPCRTGNLPQRRVREGLRPPPFSLRVRRPGARSASGPEKSRDSAGFWVTASANSKWRRLGMAPDGAAFLDSLCGPFRWFGLVRVDHFEIV